MEIAKRGKMLPGKSSKCVSVTVSVTCITLSRSRLWLVVLCVLPNKFSSKIETTHRARLFSARDREIHALKCRGLVLGLGKDEKCLLGKKEINVCEQTIWLPRRRCHNLIIECNGIKIPNLIVAAEPSSRNSRTKVFVFNPIWFKITVTLLMHLLCLSFQVFSFLT